MFSIIICCHISITTLLYFPCDIQAMCTIMKQWKSRQKRERIFLLRCLPFVLCIPLLYVLCLLSICMYLYTHDVCLSSTMYSLDLENPTKPQSTTSTPYSNNRERALSRCIVYHDQKSCSIEYTICQNLCCSLYSRKLSLIILLQHSIYPFFANVIVTEQ